MATERQATDVEITEPLLATYVPPAAASPGVCRVCHGVTSSPTWPTCWNCRAVPAQGVSIVVPVSLVHTVESQLYAACRDYKSAGVPASTSARHGLVLAATLQRFLREHRHCIEGAAGSTWDTITIVPSTRGRAGPHPLEHVIGRAPRLHGEYAATLTGTGVAIGRTEVKPEAFAPVAGVSGRRVLIVDDTFTTGARIQSAAVALTRAGAKVVAAVPIGRVIDTERTEKSAYWKQQRAIAFDFATCCLEGV